LQYSIALQFFEYPPVAVMPVIIESFRLEKTVKIIESNCKPNTVKSTTKPCP